MVLKRSPSSTAPSAVSPEAATQGLAAQSRRKGNLGTLTKALKVLAGFVLLGLALRDVDLARIPAALARLEGGWAAAVAATVIAGLAMKGIRWQVLARPVLPSLSPGEAMGALLTGQAVNLLGVFRGGDVVRAAMTASAAPPLLPAVLTAIVVEKAVDMMMLATAILFLLPALSPAIPLAAHGPLLLASGAGALLGVIIVSRLAPEVWRWVRGSLSDNPSAAIRKLVSLGDGTSAGLVRLRSFRGKASLVILTGLAWSAMLSTNMVLAWGLDIDLPLAGGVLVLVLLGVLPGLMPGEVGPVYFLARLALEQFGVGPEDSLAYAVLLHAAIVLPPGLGAVGYFLLGRRHAFRKTGSRREREPIPPPGG